MPPINSWLCKSYEGILGYRSNATPFLFKASCGKKGCAATTPLCTAIHQTFSINHEVSLTRPCPRSMQSIILPVGQLN